MIGTNGVFWYIPIALLFYGVTTDSVTLKQKKLGQVVFALRYFLYLLVAFVFVFFFYHIFYDNF